MENNSGNNHLASGQQFDYLDGWRGIAISLLMLGHFFPYWRFEFGTIGVHLFFVLSGLLMAKQLFLHKTSLPTFYKRRISRIFPALYAFISLTILSYVAIGIPLSWETIAGATALVRNYYPEGFGNKLPFDHIWSLSVEEHSYIILSALVVLFGAAVAKQRNTLGALSLGCVIMAALYESEFPGFFLYSKKLIHTEVAAFGIFFSAFILLCLRSGVERQISPLVFFALPIIAIAGYHDGLPHIANMLIGLGALAVLVNILHKAPSWMLRALSISVLRKLGLWSYSLYLWQQPFFNLKVKGLLSAPAAFTMAILAGLLSYYLIEAPARNYLNRTWAQKKSEAIPVSSHETEVTQSSNEDEAEILVPNA